MDLCDQNEA
ncbi:unnamed protein product, partial [Rotaria sordida]